MDRRKMLKTIVKLQWLQNPSDRGNLNNVILETSWHYRKNREKIPKAKLMSFLEKLEQEY
jgi:hypothetical protein